MSTQTPTSSEQQPSASATAPGACSRQTAVAVPVRTRTHALRRLLESLPAWVDSVTVAETGDRSDRTELYQRSWSFDLTVAECDHDGIGNARNKALEAIPDDTEYVWVVDSDMEFTDDLVGLVAILDARSDLGGVSAMLKEPEGRRLGACHFSRQEIRGRTVLVQEFDNCATLEHVHTRDGIYRVIKADKLPQAGVFRAEALDDYSWDAGYGEYEHLDFFLGHYERTDWNWAACPDIEIAHHCGTSDEDNYREEIRTRKRRERRDRERLEEKWGIEAIANGDTRWMHYDGLPAAERLAAAIERKLPARVWVRLKGVFKR